MISRNTIDDRLCLLTGGELFEDAGTEHFEVAADFLKLGRTSSIPVSYASPAIGFLDEADVIRRLGLEILLPCLKIGDCRPGLLDRGLV